MLKKIGRLQNVMVGINRKPGQIKSVSARYGFIPMNANTDKTPSMMPLKTQEDALACLKQNGYTHYITDNGLEVAL